MSEPRPGLRTSCPRCAGVDLHFRLTGVAGTDVRPGDDVAEVVPIEDDSDLVSEAVADVPDVLPAEMEIPADDEIAFSMGERRGGMSCQRGVVILRPEYLAFLPTDEAMIPGLIIASTFVGQLIPVSDPISDLKRVVKLQADKLHKPNLEKVARLWRNSRDHFDSIVQEAARKFSGVFCARAEVVFARPRFWLTRKDVVIFRIGTIEVAAAMPRRNNLDCLLKEYREGPVPLRGLIKIVAPLSGFCTLMAAGAFCYWYFGNMTFAATLVWLGFAVLSWAGVVRCAVINWRRRR